MLNNYKLHYHGVNSQLKNQLRLKNLAYKMLNITLGIDIYNKTMLTDSLKL